MQARPIPQNPNRPLQASSQPLRFHWVRTILLGILLLIVISRLRVPPPEDGPPLPPPAPPIVAEAQPQPRVAPAIQPSTPTEAQVRELLLHFNEAFRRGRLVLDASALEGVATGAALAAEQERIADLRAAGASQQWNLLDLQITALAPAENSLTICTSEQWDMSSGPTPITPAAYIERYKLVRQGDAWLVGELDYLGGGCSA